MSKQNLYELKALPFNLQQIDKLEDYPIYSSESLKDKFSLSLHKLKNIRPCITTITRMVDENKVIPCVSYSGLLSFIVKKTISHNKNIIFQGAYSLDKNVIFIVADMKFADFLKIDQNLGYIILHELIHYCSKNDPKKFFSIFKSVFSKFYINFFNRFANAEINKLQANKISKYIYESFELEKNINFYKYANFLDDVLLDDDFKGKMKKKVAISTIVRSVNELYNTGFNSLSRLVRTDQDVYKMLRSMYMVYEKDFKILNPDTTPIQELIYPSEIPAITCYKPTTLHYTAINRIA